MRAPKSSFRARAPRVALAAALALCSSLIPLRGVVANETESWHAPVCGARAPATCLSSLSAWERDVHALQALHHHCGVDAEGNRAPAWDDAWGAVTAFVGSRDAWDATCEPSNAWLAKDVAANSASVACDWTGRILSVNIDAEGHGVYLDCPNGLPSEIESLSELVAFRVAGALRATAGGAEMADVTRPLASLRRLAVLALPSNGLRGRVPDVCDTLHGYAFDNNLETLDVRDNALTGSLPGDGLACARRLRTLDASRNDLTGVLPSAWAESLHQLRVLRFHDNPRLTGALPSAWFPPLSLSDASDASAGDAYRLGNLVELDGGDCDLTGGLPANLGGAAWLTTLRLGGNRLEGAVPGSVTRLTQLRELDLTGNALSGVLPANLFTALANSLKTVRLARNALGGAPPPFPDEGYPVLRDVDLSENYFEGAFESFGAVMLMRLNLAHNSLSGPFPNPCSSGFLDHLEIQGNAFAGAFPDVSCLSQLTFVDASANAFESLGGDGRWIARNRVGDISFRSNALRGSLPSSGICGPYTRRIDLSGNAALAGAIPESVGSCAGLLELRLGEIADDADRSAFVADDADASGGGNGTASTDTASQTPSFSFPSNETLAKLTRLTHLRLRGIGAEGPIPASLFALPSLVELDLSHNFFSGEIPAETREFRWPAHLRHLSLSRNNLSGLVPSSLLALPSLRKLYLARNGFEGVEAFPEALLDSNETRAETQTETAAEDDFSFAAHLDQLDMSSNAFPAFPAALERVGGLTSLSLANNGMTGAIPPWLGERDTLAFLRLDGNALAGPLEDWLGNNRLLDLKSLRVDGNAKITGPLSSRAIRPMARLKRLNVSGVGAFGAFPDALGVAGASLDALTHLHARGSGLNGTLPAALFAALPNLRVLDVRDNTLEGPIPSLGLRTHTTLETLLLANNAFGGPFPRLPSAMEARAERLGVDRTRAETMDARGAGDAARGAFACPLPLNAAAYADVECTCPAGSAGPDAGRFECAPCAPGSVSAAAGASRCEPCPVGAFAEAFGGVACAPCAPGAAATQSGSARCAPCARGFFAALEASAACDACDPGTFAEEEGSVECSACPAGAAAPRPASASCDACAPGTFAAEPTHPALGSAQCAPCPAGTHSASEGSTACVACAPGHVARLEGSSTCVPCDEGTFAANVGASECSSCPAGSAAPERGATGCDACAKGAFAAAEGNARCSPCPLGTFGAEEGMGSCDACPVGTFASEEGSAACIACSPGAFADVPGAATCRLCAKGTSQDATGAETCSPCPLGAFADATGAETCAPCPLGTFADSSGAEKCAPCAVGAFADEAGAATCAACPAGSVAEREGSAACAPCAPGTFQNETGASACVACAVGSFASGAAATRCDACPAGSASDAPGATKCSACLPGSAAQPGAGTCAACGAGFFAAGAEAERCAACPAGTFQNSTGQSSCAACPAGTASEAEGAGDAGTCVACPEGTSTGGREGASLCASCEAGAFAEGGAEACALAEPGFAASVAGATGQTPCPPGTHAPGRGNTACLPCPADHAAPSLGASRCSSCPPGSESAEGAAACACAAGYRDATDLFAAPDLVADSGALATPVCVACEPGTHSDGARCVACPPDAFAAGNATRACEKIEPGYVGSDFVEPTTMRGARAQTPCPAGSRSRAALVGLALVPQCEACPEGTVAPLAGSATCAACAPGFEPDATRVVCVGAGANADGVAGAADASLPSLGDDGEGGGGGSNFDVDYADAFAALAAIEDEGSATGAMSAKTSAAAFFALLGACALCLFLFLRWWRARRARARWLAFEREAALDAAEEDIAETGTIRRATLFALANVDARATAFGEDLAKGEKGANLSVSDWDDDRAANERRARRRFLPPWAASLNPFKARSDEGDGRIGHRRRHERGHARYSAARVARAASGILPAGAPRASGSARMSVARRVDRLDRLVRLSRARGKSRAPPPRGSRFEPGRRRDDFYSDSDADADALERLNASPNAFSDDRSSHDEEAAFESAVLAAARRASRFERDRRDRRRDSRAAFSREKEKVSSVPPNRDDDDWRRLLDAPSSGARSGDRSNEDASGAAGDASAPALALLSDVVAETETNNRSRRETARRPWKMFRGGGAA